MRLIDRTLDLIFPPRCTFCGRITAAEEHELCTACERELPYIQPDMQLKLISGIKGCVSPLYYKDMVRESLIRYKFKGKNSYYRTYAKLIAKCIDGNSISCDIISWVPLSRKRLKKRGYNQSELIAREIARLLKIPCTAVLKKIKDNPPQSGTADESQRRRNVAGVYRLCAEVSGMSILLIDDIVTTGSTLAECALILSDGGAASVFAATLARTEKE